MTAPAAGAFKRTALSLFVDDTHFDPPDQVARLLAFCQDLGVRGKLSLISAFDCLALGETFGMAAGAAQPAFLTALQGASARGFDVHMELMTHDVLWDFAAGHLHSGGPCEGIWLYDPEVSRADYTAYFGAVLDHAARSGVTINGVSVPGCDCARCADTWADLQARGHHVVSANAVSALLGLAVEGRFGVPVVALYSDEADASHPTALLRSQGRFAVYDARLDMSVQDRIGFDGRLDADFYISADGKSGRIAELVLSGADQCFFCAHWFSMNPSEGEGWQVFQEILHRIHDTLADRIAWVTPSAYGARLLDAARMDALLVPLG